MSNQSIDKCCLCNQTFDESNHPRIMPSCDHSVCTNCLKNSIKNQLKILTCKFCGNQQQITDSDLQYFPKNIALIKSLKDSSMKKSLNSSEVSNPNKVSQVKSSNTALISSTAAFQLSQASDLLKSDSSLISRKSSSIMPQIETNKLCSIHQKELEIICLTDFTRLCALCAVFGTHKDHQLKTVDQTTKMLTYTAQQFDQIKQKKKSLQTRIKNSEFKSQIVEKISGAKNKLSKQIKDQFTTLKQAVAQAQKNANDDLNKRFKQVHDKINKLAKEESDFQGLFTNWARTIELQLAETSRVDLGYQQKVRIYWQNIINSVKEGSFYLSQIQLYTEEKKKRLESVPNLVSITLGDNLVKDIYNHVIVKFDQSAVDKVVNEVLLTASKAEQNMLRLQMEGKINTNFNQNLSNIPAYNNTQKNAPFSNIKLNSLPVLQHNQSPTTLLKKPIQVEFSSSQNFLSPAKQKMLSPPSSQMRSQNLRKSPRQKSKSLPKPPHPNSTSHIPKSIISPPKKQLASTVSNFQISAQKRKLQTTVEGIVDLFISDEKLDTLDLCSFEMPDIEILATLNYVISQKKIKCLKLSHNKLTNEGFNEMISLLKFTTNLNLSYNLLTEDILNQLIKQRQKLPSLRILNLSHNKVNERKAKVYVEELKRQGIIVTL